MRACYGLHNNAKLLDFGGESFVNTICRGNDDRDSYNISGCFSAQVGVGVKACQLFTQAATASSLRSIYLFISVNL